jgi:hypothetical protein
MDPSEENKKETQGYLPVFQGNPSPDKTPEASRDLIPLGARCQNPPPDLRKVDGSVDDQTIGIPGRDAGIIGNQLGLQTLGFLKFGFGFLHPEF